MILIVDKPAGITSHKVVSAVRRACGVQRAGHTGTLDPICTGVLPVLTGHDTKLSDLFCSDKEYIATVLLGVRTDTQDITGAVLQRSPVDVSQEQFVSALKSFEGDLSQTPPMYSAVKVAGRKLYELARNGIEIERKSRTVKIYETECLGLVGCNEYSIRVKCSRGTYIRTICDELGARLGCGGTMTSLRRTRSNGFDLSQAHPLDEVIRYAESGLLSGICVGAEAAFSDAGRCIVPSDGQRYYLNGGLIAYSRLKTAELRVGAVVRAYSEDGAFLGLARCADGGIKCIWQNRSDTER